MSHQPVGRGAVPDERLSLADATTAIFPTQNWRQFRTRFGLFSDASNPSGRENQPMPRFRRHFGYNQTVFLTLVTGNRQPWLRPPREKHGAVNVLRKIPERFDIRNSAYVILDDHLHWLLQAGSADIPRLVTAFKQRMNFDRRDAGLAWRRLWQKRYFDHVIRDENDFRIHLDYIHYNPVKHGYVPSASKYPWSSFQGWVRRGVYESDWGINTAPEVGNLEFE